MLSKLLVKIALGVGIPLGSLSLGVMPGATAIVPLLNPTIGGTNSTDFYLRCANSTPGVVPQVPPGSVLPCPNPTTTQFLDEVLQGGPVPPPGNPGGNVELAFSSETPGFDFTKFTSLEGTILGKNFFARSLTAADWTDTFTRKFLDDALVANNFDPIFRTPAVFNPLVSAFTSLGGPQRFSDPNITYVSADETGNLTVGLAGQLNSSQLLKQFFTGSIPQFLVDLIPAEVQVSEVVYVNYYQGQAGYFYSFEAANSGQSSDDQGAIPGCNGGAPTPENGLENCSYSGDFQVSQIVGNTPTNPVFPTTTNPDGSFSFIDFPVFDIGQTIYFDPPAVEGYEFVIDNGPLFTSALFLEGAGTGANNNEYSIFFDQGGSCNNFVTPGGTAFGGIPFLFNPSVPCFAVTGINPALGLEQGNYDPNNPNFVPFPVGFTFNGTGLVSFTQTPVTTIPEPMTLLGAAVAMGFGAQFKRKRTNSQD